MLRTEHQLYPLALRLIAAGKVRVEDERAIVNEAPAGASDDGGIMFNPAIA